MDPAREVPSGDGPRLRSLARMARSLGRSGDLRQVVEIAAEEACAAIEADSGTVSRFEPDAAQMRVLVNVGTLGYDEEHYPAAETYPLDDFPNLSLVVSEMLPWRCAIGDERGDLAERELLLRLGKGASMGAPIVVDGALWGELYVTRSRGRHPFSDDDLAYLEALSAILSSGVSRAESELRLRELAYRDPLTHLVNRRGLDDAARTMVAAGHGLAVACFDVNGLKAVNDRLGHPAGDTLLMEIAVRLQSAEASIRGAVAARTGGDEFCLAMPSTDRSLVDRVLTELCAEVRAIPHPEGMACGVHAAAGPVSGPVFAEADRAMYVAKQSGRRQPLWADDLPFR